MAEPGAKTGVRELSPAPLRALASAAHRRDQDAGHTDPHARRGRFIRIARIARLPVTGARHIRTSRRNSARNHSSRSPFRRQPRKFCTLLPLYTVVGDRDTCVRGRIIRPLSSPSPKALSFLPLGRSTSVRCPALPARLARRCDPRCRPPCFRVALEGARRQRRSRRGDEQTPKSAAATMMAAAASVYRRPSPRRTFLDLLICSPYLRAGARPRPSAKKTSDGLKTPAPLRSPVLVRGPCAASSTWRDT